MRADFRVLIDSCVLANYSVCDLLLRLSERPRLILQFWSEEILAEVKRTQIDKLDWPPHLADSFNREVNLAFPHSCVQGYEDLVPLLQNDEKDRHVLAAAIRGGCSLIVTFNLKHFPQDSLKPWSIVATHPDDYLVVLYDMDPQRVALCIGEIAGRRQIDREDQLIQFGKVLPKFAGRLLDELNG